MINVEMEDVLAVLELCKPYIVGMTVALVIGIAVIIACRRISKSRRFLVRGEAAIAMLLAVITGVNLICFGPMSTLIGLAMGSGTISDETNAEAAELAEEIEAASAIISANSSVLTGMMCGCYACAAWRPAFPPCSERL